MGRIRVIVIDNGLFDIRWNGGPVYSAVYRSLAQAMDAALKFAFYVGCEKSC